MKKKDITLILIVLSMIIIFFGINYVRNSKTTDSIEVYVNNKLYKSILINEEDEFTINLDEGYNVVKVHNNGVEVKEASCPDKVCVHTGFINKSSQSIVCIPNKVNIKIKSSDKENKEDVIAN